ncbi:MULE domain-containing protein [Aphis craccivora]|uniref:MULE domain-containing protein n=1 Tax=Aphis craccivora TaxID=307492 RepID=A0A6G0YYA0_APHCR|nr:MULE domain-containing protein [Aphis craccivora]
MFPHIPVFGCRFYLGQSWWRKIQSLGLSIEYRKFDSSISIFLRSLFGLPFIPPNALLDTYISKSALFPPSIWAEYNLVYPVPQTIASHFIRNSTVIFILQNQTYLNSQKL